VATPARSATSKADEAARRNPELEAHPAAAVIDHLRHGPAPRAAHRDDHALELFGHVDDQVLHRLHAPTVDLARHDLGS
jgi:hypothetical protein